MEWAKETMKAVTNSRAVEGAASVAEGAYNTAAEYMPAGGGTNGPSMTASIINTAPFSSFKPDPANVWKGYLIYVVLSFGCTLPWWTLVLAADYFQHLYPHSHIIRLFPLAYFGPWLIVYSLFSAFGREYTSWLRINLGVVIAALALAVIPVLDGFIQGRLGSGTTFWVTMVVVGVAGAGDAVAQGSLLGISAELPERFTHAYVVGASLSGVMMFVVRMITKAALSSSPGGLRTGAIIYFCVGLTFMILVLSLFAYVHYMPAMGYYSSLGLGSFDTVRLLLEDEASVTVEIAASAGIAAVAAGRSCPALPLDYKPTLGRMKLLGVAVAITSITSLVIFPGYLTEDVHSRSLGSWFPVLLVGTYVVTDFLGRSLTKYTMLDSHSALLGSALTRLLILAFFVFALFGSKATRTPMTFALTALLGATNGFLIACLTIVMPRSNPANQAEPAGIIMASIMTVGTLIGAGLSWFWVLL